MPGQRPEALTARDIPHFERAVDRPGHDVAVRQGGDAPDLRLSRFRRTIDARFDLTPAPRLGRVLAQRRRAAVAPKGSHGLRNKCSNTVIAFILESHFLLFEFPTAGRGEMMDTTEMATWSEHLLFKISHSGQVSEACILHA